MALQPATPAQLVLDIGVEIQRDVNGIEMGVLENGIPFLTQSGLAKIAGIARSVLFDINQDWESRYNDPILGNDRHSRIKEYLARHGFNENRLYIETVRDGSPHHAYPDIVCMAIIEYYAFEAKNKSNAAIENYRRFAAFGFQKFIYEALNYSPADKWKYHNDRVSILQNAGLDGHFIVFQEVNGLIVDLINAGLAVNDKTIPDISVGQCWGTFWRENNLDFEFGARKEYMHNFPSYYPQAASNPQKPWAYPDAALPEFRRWFRHEYLPTKFPKYILNKANVLGGQKEAQKIANLYRPSQISKS
ncbi:hypothetical protein [Brucella anthropi]|uniref:hypothetical protein n=1 Tax=Brucella anthropi TaxID=529 RepID=UPI003D9602D0